MPLRKDRDYSAILKDEPRFASMTTPPPGLTLYIEAPNTSYEEITTRMGEIIQAAFRDASLVGNVDGAKKVMMRVQRHGREDPQGQRPLFGVNRNAGAPGSQSLGARIFFRDVF